MTAEETAAMVAQIIASSSERILGIGAEQYGNGHRQGFEFKSLRALAIDGQEELLDLIAYAAFLYINLEEWKNKYGTLQS